MKRMDRLAAVILAVTWVCGLPLVSSAAADYPEKTVTMICGFPAGGGLDVTARAITEATKKYLSKPIVVVNRAGGAGSIGVAEVVAAKPDGYTIGIAAVASLAVVPHQSKLPYGPPSDYSPILNLVNIPICLSVKADSPWKNAQELIAFARANPGKLRVGLAGGLGTLFHLNVEQLKALAKIDLTTVPFAGAAESVPALLGGHVDADCHTVSEILPHVKAGKARVLGVFEEQRNPLFPDAPAFKELGYDITLAAYYLVFAPKSLPPPVFNTLHDAFKKGMEEPVFTGVIREKGYEVQYLGPQDITARLMKDYESNRKLVDALDLKAK